VSTCVFQAFLRFSKAENPGSSIHRVSTEVTRGILALLGLSALMLAATGTSQAQGFTITSTPTFASTNVGQYECRRECCGQDHRHPPPITSISVPNSASGSPQFNYVSISGCTIGTAAPNNTTCTISVTFSPAYPGVQSAPLVIAYTGGTFNVGLVGTGLAPQAVLLPGVLSTVVNTAGVAGTVGQGNNGQATAAGLKLPRDIGFDYAGNYYIGDIGNGAGTTDTAEIRKVTTATGVISQFAGAGSGHDSVFFDQHRCGRNFSSIQLCNRGRV
jgi:hypothetical protein